MHPIDPSLDETDPPALEQVVEAALLAAGGPLSIEQVQGLYPEAQRPAGAAVAAAIAALADAYRERAVEIVEVAGGFRVQVRARLAPWVARLWEERPARYSRALLETLALIAYRQPITRGEIEDIRGVAVGTQIIRTLTEREWVRVVGHRDVPGRPALYATTRRFLDYFGLRSLDELPPLAALRDPAFFATDALSAAADPDPVSVPPPGQQPAGLAAHPPSAAAANPARSAGRRTDAAEALLPRRAANDPATPGPSPGAPGTDEPSGDPE
ncbi:MAG: SMC-Scp complex subunit ScpB [Chromatiaceae bacterium]|nr:MAG: SMC-Scp complex subunit ScpB [Chromatiaceae bacterium]